MEIKWRFKKRNTDLALNWCLTPSQRSSSSESVTFPSVNPCKDTPFSSWTQWWISKSINSHYSTVLLVLKSIHTNSCYSCNQTHHLYPILAHTCHIMFTKKTCAIKTSDRRIIKPNPKASAIPIAQLLLLLFFILYAWPCVINVTDVFV